MRSLLVLTCCIALAPLAARADQDKHKKKKEQQQAQQSQTQPGDKSSARPTKGTQGQTGQTQQGANGAYQANSNGNRKGAVAIPAFMRNARKAKSTESGKPTGAGKATSNLTGGHTSKRADGVVVQKVTDIATVKAIDSPTGAGKSTGAGKATSNLTGGHTSKSGKANFREFRIHKTTDAASPAGAGGQKTKGKAKGSQQSTAEGGPLYIGRNDGKVQQVGAANAKPLPGTPAVQLHKFSNTTFKTQHFNLPSKSKPATSVAPAVNFQQGRHIQGSQNWQGSNYQVFRSYKSEWHDKNWWSNHYNRVVFVYGGWYAWNPGGWWIPAWGYAPNAYYAWDGPIYAYNDLPPDQVIANVQAALQEQGYYQGEVDGLIGPLTREALANYQRDHGLYETAAIDQPTLESLGMA